MSKINNSFRFTGYVGDKPETRFNSQTGELVAMQLSIGVDGSYKDKKNNGAVVDHTDWFDLSCYAKSLNEKVIQPYVEKGTRVQVRGRMRKVVWDSKTRFNDDQTPKKDSRIEFVMTEILLLGRPKNSTLPDSAEAAIGNTYTADSDEIDFDAVGIPE